MNLKYFDNINGEWLDISGQPGASLEYDAETSGWVTSGGYKKYVAIISQVGTDDPIVIVLENTLGFEPDWKRDSAGIYGFDFVGYDFFYEKCTAIISQYYPDNNITWITYEDIYQITVKTSKGDDYIRKQTVEIRYYN